MSYGCDWLFPKEKFKIDKINDVYDACYKLYSTKTLCVKTSLKKKTQGKKVVISKRDLVFFFQVNS